MVVATVFPLRFNRLSPSISLVLIYSRVVLGGLISLILFFFFSSDLFIIALLYLADRTDISTLRRSKLKISEFGTFLNIRRLC